MAYKSSLLYGIAVALKVCGILTALIGLFVPTHRTFLIPFGLILVLLGYFVSLLDEIFHRPESLPPLDSPSLRLRWKAGFIVLLYCGFSLYWLYQPINATVDWLARGEGLPIDAALAFKALAFVLLGPFLIAVLTEPRALARIGAFWFRGFKHGLVGGLVVLPWFLLKLAYSLIVRLGYIEAETDLDARLELVVLGLSIVLVPLWVLPLFRQLSRLPMSGDVVAPLLQKRPAVDPGKTN